MIKVTKDKTEFSLRTKKRFIRLLLCVAVMFCIGCAGKNPQETPVYNPEHLVHNALRETLTPAIPSVTDAGTPTETPTPTEELPVITETPVPTEEIPVITETPTPTEELPVITEPPAPTEELPVITEPPVPTEEVLPTEAPEPTAAETEPAQDLIVKEVNGKVRIIDPSKPMIALTFDDGPHPTYTVRLMELFEEYNSGATFFVVGYFVDSRGAVTIDAYNRGFQIGNHTLNHPVLPNLSEDKLMQEIMGMAEKLNNAGIEGNLMMRPPYGSWNEYMAENLTMPMIGWSIDSRDWDSQDPDKIWDEVIGKVKDGDIVLFHDIYSTTVEAAERIVPELVAQGFQLVTVEELFEAKGITPEAGVYYRYLRPEE